MRVDQCGHVRADGRGREAGRFDVDVFSRRIVGWSLATHLRTALPLAALEHALWHRRHQTRDGLVHHSDAGSQYTAIRYGERLTEAGIVPSIGSVGDSYDNALAESAVGLFKTELVELHGRWRTHTDLKLAVLEYINWFNTAPPHGELGHVTPREYEEVQYRQHHPDPDRGRKPHMTLSTEPTAVHADQASTPVTGVVHVRAVPDRPWRRRRAAAAKQQARVVHWIVERMTKRGVSQREMARAGVASQSAIYDLLTGKAWSDLWVVSRVVAHLGGQLGVRATD